MQSNLYTYQITIKKVIDGDTVVGDVDLGFNFVLRNQHVRLARINAPEMHGESKVQGEKSREALLNKIFGKNAYIKTHKDDKEKYGRLLADLYLEDGTCINDWLLSENLARPYVL
jgi:micrococcal nuclease